jgi:hypothetical protein
MKYVYQLPGLVDSEDDAVGLEKKLPEVLFQVLSFPERRHNAREIAPTCLSDRRVLEATARH